ncbi:hypothetical protein ES705_05384 [subsurface metagenome]
MKKILLAILVVVLSLISLMIWIGLAFNICIILSVVDSVDSFGLVIAYFVLSFVSLGYLWKSIIRMNALKGLVKIRNNIWKYLDLD